MNTVCFETPLEEEQLKTLKEEFPLHQFISLESLSPDEKKLAWEKMEVYYGTHFSKKDLANAHHLRWVHLSLPSLEHTCLKHIHEQGNILLTNTRGESAVQYSEYVLAATLAFSKNLFLWKKDESCPQTLPPQENMWKLKGKTFLQIGLGRVGSQIAAKMRKNDLRVWGMRRQRTFHAECDKTFAYKDLHSLLPNADIVCLCLPRAEVYKDWFGKGELDLMKDGSILIVLGAKGVIEEKALNAVAQSERFKGILIDTPEMVRENTRSNILFTPAVGGNPRDQKGYAFRTFRHNFRQFIHHNFGEMENLVRSNVEI